MSGFPKKMMVLFLKEIGKYNQLIIDKQNENEIAEFFELDNLNIIAEEFFLNYEKPAKKSVTKKEKKVLDESEKCSATTSSGKECSKKRTTKEEYIGTEYETLCLTHINTLKNGKTKQSKSTDQLVDEIDEPIEIDETVEIEEKVVKPKKSKKVKSDEIIEEENL